MDWILVGLLVLGGGWMTYDGTRALITGEYTTPSSGKYAGHLGPWADVVRSVGLEPRSVPVKVVFVVLGLAGLGAATFTILALPAAKWLVMAFAVASLWYLPVGTLVSILDLAIVLARWKALP